MVAPDARESNNISESSTRWRPLIELLQTTPGATTKSTQSCASHPPSTTAPTYGAAGSEAGNDCISNRSLAGQRFAAP